MKWFIVLSFATVALARPEAGYSSGAASSHNGNGNGYPSGAASTHNGNGYPSGAASAAQGGYPEGPAKVTRHVYVHVAPDESEEPAPSPYQDLTPNKHYKIIFIKSPDYKFAPATVQSTGGLNPEKTIVYVLSKRPEVPAPEIVGQENDYKPDKPEIYFIKYKGAHPDPPPGGQKEYGVPSVPSAPAHSAPAHSAPGPSSLYGGPSASAPAPSSSYGSPTFRKK